MEIKRKGHSITFGYSQVELLLAVTLLGKGALAGLAIVR